MRGDALHVDFAGSHPQVEEPLNANEAVTLSAVTYALALLLAPLARAEETRLHVFAAASLGEAVEGHPDQRRFRVRRLDAFARWILGAAGAVEPLGPPELVAEYREQVRRTLAVYEGPS